MDYDKKFASELLQSPTNVQRQMLTDMEERCNQTGDNVIERIVDTNNSFCLMVEGVGNLAAHMMATIEHKYPSLYPKRARTSEDLYANMSDFDYLNLTANPSEYNVRIMLAKKYITENAVSFNADYKKIIIPAETAFIVGPYKFGIYYPIEIRINTKTQNITAVHTALEDNPLSKLPDNSVLVTEVKYEGLDLISLDVDVFQFEKTRVEEDVFTGSGFNKTYSFNDKFYAMRVYTLAGNTWKELAITFADKIYDVNMPTAKLQLLLESNQVKVHIPKTYFSSDDMGTKVRLDIFTTKGSLDTPMLEYLSSPVDVKFNVGQLSDKTYSNILTKLPTLEVTAEGDYLVGGSNGLTFEQLRDRVVNRSLYDSVPISPPELHNFAADRGFYIEKHIDNITDRIYYLYREVKGGSQSTVKIANMNIKLSPDTLSNISGINEFQESISVLPTTMFKYNSAADLCVPVDDERLAEIALLGREDLCTLFNTDTYTRTPFFYSTFTTRTPHTKVFDLQDTKVQNIISLSENINMSEQATCVKAEVFHDTAACNGYLLRMAIEKTEAFSKFDTSALRVLVAMKTAYGSTVYREASYTGKLTVNDFTDLYDLRLETEYQFSENGELFFTNFTNGTATTPVPVSMITDVQVITFIDNDYFPYIVNPTSTSLPADYSGSLFITEQKLTIKFGNDLTKSIFSKTNALWDNKEYVCHEVDVIKTYSNDVYERDAEGNLTYTLVEGQPTLELKHAAGDPILNTDGEQVKLHHKGDLILDEDGEPIVRSDSKLLYYLSSIQLDTRIYYSDNAVDKTFVNSIGSVISGYSNAVEEIQENLLEQTELYFLPKGSIGSAIFGLGNGLTTTIPVDLSFQFKVYVPTTTLENSNLTDLINNAIRTTVNSHMDKDIISSVAMAEEVKSIFGEAISSIDVVGINNQQHLQTLVVKQKKIKPMVRQLLIHNKDGSLTMDKDITIEILPEV